MFNFFVWVARYLRWTTGNTVRNWRRNWHSIKWSAYAGVPDAWHWGLSVGMWYDADPGFHFTGCGVSIRVGPFLAWAQGNDTN